MAPSNSSLAFTVRRCKPELVTPAKPTPREIKLLSDIDDQDGLRFQIPVIQFYKYDPLKAGKDPVEVIRKAIAKPFVFTIHLQRGARINADSYLHFPAPPMSFSSNNINISGSSVMDGFSVI